MKGEVKLPREAHGGMLVRVTIAVIKRRDQKQPEEGTSFYPLRPQSLTEKRQGRS